MTYPTGMSERSVVVLIRDRVLLFPPEDGLFGSLRQGLVVFCLPRMTYVTRESGTGTRTKARTITQKKKTPPSQ